MDLGVRGVGAEEPATGQGRLTEEWDDLKTVAARIGKDAEKVGLQATSAATTIRRLLTEAQTSLSGVGAIDEDKGAA